MCSNQRYWVFKHTWNGITPSEQEELINIALDNKFAFMQYEYGLQNHGVVTPTYKNLNEIKPGDIAFLRGSNYIYAYGTIILPRKKGKLSLYLKDIISNKRSPVSSENSTDVYTFTDAPAFYFDFSENKKENWGQRVDVEHWLNDGENIFKIIKPLEYIGNLINYPPVREITKNCAFNIINKLSGGVI